MKRKKANAELMFILAALLTCSVFAQGAEEGNYPGLSDNWAASPAKTVNRIPHPGKPGDFIEIDIPEQGAEKISQDEYGWQLTSTQGMKQYTTHWSSDGQWIAFNQDGEIWIVPASGGNAINLTDTIEDNLTWQSFTPDSKEVVVANR